MSRKIKSVSIPERLFSKVEDIPNFTQWVLQALDDDQPALKNSVSSAAYERRMRIHVLEDVIEDLQCIRNDLKDVRSANHQTWSKRIVALSNNIHALQQAYMLEKQRLRR